MTLDAATQPLKYLHGLATAASRAGAHIFENSLLTGWNEVAPQKILHLASGGQVTARIVMLCGNAYLADIGLPQMHTRLAFLVTSSILATKPLSQEDYDPVRYCQLALPWQIAQCRTELLPYRCFRPNGVWRTGKLFEHRTWCGRARLRRRMSAVFPLLADAETEQVWSGRIGITTVSRICKLSGQAVMISISCRVSQAMGWR